MSQQQPSGPPYLPHRTALGGIPTTHVDIPICAVLLLLYLLGLLTHALIYRRNRTNDSTKFRLSILIIYMCFVRLITMSMRIAWAMHTQNPRLAIASQVFTTAGVLLLYVLNIVFCQRIMRAWHPRFGWKRVTSWAFPVFYATIPLSLVALITAFVQSLYTLDLGAREADHAVQMYGITFFLTVAVFPVPFILVNYLLFLVERRRGKELPVENMFPTMAGDVGKSAGIVVLATLVLVTGMGFRTGTSWAAPRSPSDPAWYDSKACYYLFNFVTELAVVLLYAAVRVDRLFFVRGKGDERGRFEDSRGKGED